MYKSIKCIRVTRSVADRVTQAEEDLFKRIYGNITQIRRYSECSDKCKQLPASPPPSPLRSVESVRQNPTSNPTTSQNDPYRIRVPRVTVVPIPSSEAKPMVMCPCKLGGGCPPRGHLCVPPPPPPPPPRRIPPILYAIPIFMGISGLIYRIYMHRLESIAKREAELKLPWRPRNMARRPQYSQDIPDSVPYLIIGAGTAGMAAYSAILQQDPCAKVFLISTEDILPYERPPLSKGIWFNQQPLDPKKLIWTNGQKRVSMLYATAAEFTEVENFARAHGPAVSVATGWRVTRVDADERTVYLHTRAGEQPLKYKKCLIATGAKPLTLEVFRNAPPEVRERVCKLRTVRDAEAAWAMLQNARRCVIVGGGLLASELSWTLGHLYNKTDRGECATPPVEIVHIIKEKGILRHIIPDYLAEWAAEKIKDEGVLLVPKTEIHDAFISPETDRLSLHLSSGKVIETDYVFACVGAVPNVELAEASLLEVDPDRGGLLVNTELLARTDLYVAGDAASVYKQRAAARASQHHILDAVQSGCLAGLNMTGHSAPYNDPAHFHLRLGNGVHMEALGEVSACLTTIGVFAKVTTEVAASETKSKAVGGVTTSTTTVNTVGAKPNLGSEVGKVDVPCYKKTAEYRNRYAKGIVYYVKDEKVVGVVFWNVDDGPVEERKEVIAEILRAEPSYEDIGLITELLQFNEQCHYEPSNKSI